MYLVGEEMVTGGKGVVVGQMKSCEVKKVRVSWCR